LGWLNCAVALPSTLTCSRCLPSSLKISSFETAPAVLGCQVIGSTTLLCGQTDALQLRLAAAGSAGSSDSEKPSCTGTFSAARCCVKHCIERNRSSDGCNSDSCCQRVAVSRTCCSGMHH
jgi:hypothetical protein